MKYFSNFARLGKPTLPSPNRFNNMNPVDWRKYDIDWQEFNEINQNYLHLGIPPIMSQRYRYDYTKFWNGGLVDTMKNANSVFGQFQNSPPTPRMFTPSAVTGQISMYPIKVEIEGESDDPVRELWRLQQSRNTLQTPSLSVSTESINYEQLPSDEHEVFKSETTTILLIAVIVAFLFVNLMGLLIYLYRRNKKLHRKYDNTNIFIDDDKRSKFADTDDSFILRKSNNTYESVKRHSPINGFGMARHISTSTVDTHMKVSDWISSEIPQSTISSSFSKGGKVSVAIDATPQARSNSILRQEPIEITKAKSFDYGHCGRIVCQDVDMDSSLIDEIPFREFRERSESCSSDCSSFSHCEECANSHQHSYSDPATRNFYQQEEVTSFIEPCDVNVTCRDDAEKSPLTREESLRNIQRMNCPKVLPSYPENLQFNDSTKRRSLQISPQFYQIHSNTLSNRSRPHPPPRMSSTLGRNKTKVENRASFFMSEPQEAECKPPPPPEPEITSTTLNVGPLIPKAESIYMSMQRKNSLNRQNSTTSQDANQEKPPLEAAQPPIQTEHLYAEIIKNSRVQTPQDGIYSITTGKPLKATNSQESNSSSSSSEDSSTGTIKELH